MLRLSPSLTYCKFRVVWGELGSPPSGGGASDASMRDQIQLPPSHRRLGGASWGETPPLKLNLVSEGAIVQ